MSKYNEIQEQIKKLQEQAEQIRKSELESVIADIKHKIAQFHLTAKDLGLGAAGKRGRKPAGETGGATVAPKYKGPHGELWTGRGRQPLWVKAALGSGKTMNDLLIK